MRPHARTKTDRAASLPTASGGIARAAYARAVEAGLPGEALLAEAGLTAAQISRPDVRIPVRSQIRLLNEAARQLDDDFLGIRLAQSVDLREIGLLYYVAASCEDLRTALERLARYSTINNEGVHIGVRAGREITVSFEHVGVQRSSDRHQIEFFVTILIRLCSQLTARRLSPARVRLMHRRAEMTPDLGPSLGCAVEFGAPIDQVVFPAAARTTPLAHADPYLNQILLRYCEEVMAHRRRKPVDWRTKVENAIVPLLPHGEATIGNVARRLGVSSRTLARRLADDGLSFAQVLQDLRVHLAHEYFDEPGMQVTRVAWLLGYRDSSAFSHAFKRWTGRSPRERRTNAPPATT